MSSNTIDTAASINQPARSILAQYFMRLTATGRAQATGQSRANPTTLAAFSRIMYVAMHERLSTNMRFMTPDELFRELGVADDYARFIREGGPQFASLASSAPVFTAEGLHYLEDPQGPRAGQAALAEYFFQLWNAMVRQGLPESGEAAYTLTDCQSAEDQGWLPMPHGVFHYAPCTTLGVQSAHVILAIDEAPYSDNMSRKTWDQFSSFAANVWQSQPTRIFVPILCIQGSRLVLFILTHSSLYRINIGPICVDERYWSSIGMDVIEGTLLRLWFLMVLRPDQFGHLCDIKGVHEHLRFTTTEEGTAVSTSTASDPLAVCLNDRILQIRPAIYRSTYVYRSSFQGQDAVLKMAWTRLSYPHEAVIYDIMHKSNVKGIPAVYSSGFIGKIPFGYRFEYIVLENCGTSISAYFNERRAAGTSTKKLCTTIKGFIKQVVSCLVHAYQAGIVHRDISAANITIRGGQAYVIGWGYAKVLGSVSLEAAAEIAEKWNTSLESVAQSCINLDMSMEMLPYMSIRVLCGAGQRDVFDDIESLFYVILDVVSSMQANPATSRDGFDHEDKRSLGLVRIGCLSGISHYLEHFGITACPVGLKATLDAMYRFLFCHDGCFLGNRLAKGHYLERTIDRKLGAVFMDSESLGILCDVFSVSKSAGPSAGLMTRKRKHQALESSTTKKSRGK
ncbi:hypothetical protein GQ54DRAFT_321172 [Martensiomyces pterosporus]|nr:hypothetical protein GQ54DRAFT_321172 [Martensiomyces pterosporus]